jgi:hypothetical protein
VKICVLVKEVPDAAVEKRIDPSTGRMDRSGEKNINLKQAILASGAGSPAGIGLTRFQRGPWGR